MHLKQNILFPREIAHTEQFSVACARFLPGIGVASTLDVDAIVASTLDVDAKVASTSSVDAGWHRRSMSMPRGIDAVASM